MNTAFSWTTLLLVLGVMPKLSSCVYIPPVSDAFDSVNRIETIEPGVTTREEVLQELGQPDSNTLYYDPANYTYSGYKSDGIMVGLADGGPTKWPINQKKWHVVVHFDKNDIVSSILTSETSAS